jgi:hypothetical protein
VDQSFLGIGFSKIAFSTANPNLVVAATAGDNGLCLGLEARDWKQQSSFRALAREEDGNSTAVGLYYSLNGGATWNRATLTDGSGFRIGHGGDLQREPGSDGNVLRFHSAARAVFLDGWPELHAADYATDRGAGIGELSGEFERDDLPDLSRRVRGGAGAQRDVCVGGRRAARRLWKSTPADEGIWQSTTGGASWTQIPDNGITNCGDSAFGPNRDRTAAAAWNRVGTTWNCPRFQIRRPPIQPERTFTRVRQSLQVHVGARDYNLLAR